MSGKRQKKKKMPVHRLIFCGNADFSAPLLNIFTIFCYINEHLSSISELWNTFTYFKLKHTISYLGEII